MVGFMRLKPTLWGRDAGSLVHTHTLKVEVSSLLTDVPSTKWTVPRRPMRRSTMSAVHASSGRLSMQRRTW
jgi:hypothetical protein